MEETATTPRTKRNVIWYVKFVFAFYGAGLASWMLVMVISLPFGGFRFSERWLLPYAGVQMLLLGLAWSPLLWRRLR